MMKTLLGSVFASLLALTLFFPLPTHAGIEQVPSLIGNIGRTGTILNALPTIPVNDTKLNAKETGISVLGVSIPISWNQLALTLAKTVVNQVVDSTVTWINSGFDKNHNPAFIVDPGKYFGNIANGVAGDELNKLSKGILCTPFQAKLIISLRLATVSGGTYTPQCTLSGIVKNYNDFVKNFNSGGGWKSFFAVTQNSANNPYGAFIDAKLAIDNKSAIEVDSASKEVDWGSGFKSQKTCNKYNMTSEEVETWINQHPDSNGYPPGLNLNYAPGACLDDAGVNTPGATLKSHLDEALPANVFLRQITTADQFDKILTSLGTALLQRWVNGPNGLLGKSTGSSNPGTGGGSTEPATPVTCSASIERATAGEDTVTWTASTAFDSNTVVSFVWHDKSNPVDGRLEGKTGPSATTTYTLQGIKQASVTASTTQLDDLGEPIPGSHKENRDYPCTGTVTVSIHHPLDVSCVANTPRVTIPPGEDKSDPVTYTATITGGSGKFTLIKWEGNQEVPPKASGLANTIWPYGTTGELSNTALINWCYGDTGGVNLGFHIGPVCDAYLAKNGLKGGNFRTGVTQQTLTKAPSSVPTLPVFTSTVSRIYFKPTDANLGSVQATITVFDDDVLLEPVTKKECPVSPIPVLDY
jgi:hypothetical protein